MTRRQAGTSGRSWRPGDPSAPSRPVLWPVELDPGASSRPRRSLVAGIVAGAALPALVLSILASAPRPAATAIPTDAPARDLVAVPAGPAVSASGGNPSQPTTAPGTSIEGATAGPDALQRVARSGTIAFADESHGPAYLAIPIGPGHLVTVCGDAGCWTTVSTDAGPALSMQRAGRIADVAVGQWERICGVPRELGLCEGSWTVVDATPPPTETDP